MDFDRYDRLRPIQWQGDALELLDQRKLPFDTQYLRCQSAADVAQAIRDLVVRGAPAIGISAAWGLVLAAKDCKASEGPQARAQMADVFDLLRAARPTAVNLMWALDRMSAVLQTAGSDWHAVLTVEAQAIATEDLAANRHMGALGADLIAPGSGVLTHCNTGSLATAGFGTALGVIRAGVAMARVAQVFASETRPWGQGARLTAWELQHDGIDVSLIADGAGAHLMKEGKVQWLIVGADRICANGDTANKIGTYHHAIAAKRHGVKVMVVAPHSTVDMATPSGEEIEIELRDGRELLFNGAQRVVAEGVAAWNPVFDVTPADLIDFIVTDKGVIESPNREKMIAVFGSKSSR